MARFFHNYFLTFGGFMEPSCMGLWRGVKLAGVLFRDGDAKAFGGLGHMPDNGGGVWNELPSFLPNPSPEKRVVIA